MADNPYGLSAQDVQDLQQIAMHMQSDDPRRNKVNLLLNSAPTQFEQSGGHSADERFASATPEQGLASRGANFIRGAVSSVTAPFLHPSETLQGMGQGVVAGGSTPYGTPITAPTGNQQIDQQNENIHRQAQQQAIDSGAQELKDHPSYMAGQFAGPVIAGGAAKAVSTTPFFLKNFGSTVDSIKNAPSTLMNKADSFVLGNDPAKTIVRATKPTVGLPEYEQSVRSALPELAKYNPQNLKQLVNAADEIKTTKNMEYQGLKAKAGNAPVPTYSVASAQRESIPATNQFEDPNIIEKTNTKAARYQTTMPIEQADAIRVDTNAKLRDFYNKAGGDQAAALSNPETARTFAVNQGMRDELYSTLQQQTGVDPRPIQEMYGNAVDIGDTAGKRSTVFSRQQPNPLQEQLNMADALKDMSVKKAIASKLFKRYGNSDTMTQIAFDQYARQHGLPANAVAPPAMAPNTGIPYFLLPLLANQKERK